MRLKTKSIISIISLILFSVLLISDYCQATGSGTTSADFLRIPVGARETALGGTFSAVSDNSNAVYYNPAGLGLLKHPEVSFTYNKYLEGIAQQWLSFAYPSRLGTFGLGLNYLSVSAFDSYDDFDNRTGSVSASDLAVFLSYGGTIDLGYKLIDSISGGISAKYISQRLDDKNGYGNAFDFGFLAVSGIKNLKLSFGIDNFSSKEIQFINEKAGLPMIYKAGVSYTITAPDAPIGILLSAQQNLPKDEDDYFSVGIENIFYGRFALRVGYSSFGNISNPVTFGFGLDLTEDRNRNIRLDYSYGISDYFGNVQKITLAYEFGNSEDRRKRVLAGKKINNISPKVAISTNGALGDLSSPEVLKSLKKIAKLGKHKSGRSIQYLFEFLDNKNPAILSAATLALKGFKDSNVIVRILKIKDKDTRANAISYLQGYNGDKILKVLEMALYDESPEIRKRAVVAFGNYGEKKAITFLVHALKKEKDENVMSEIIKALSTLSKIVEEKK
jgi:HEAT repeats/Uncharacterised protein family (UPF0164)